MPQPKFQRYKHIQISRNWRYCRAAIYSNGKVKPHVVVVGGQEEKHEEGSYCIRNKKSWIEAGTDPLPRGNTMESGDPHQRSERRGKRPRRL
jgi:hypothetical protein